MSARIKSRFPMVACMTGLALTLAVALPAGALAAEDGDFTAEKAKAPEAGDSANGLEVKLVLKERTFRMGGGDNAAEQKIKVLTLELKNVGDKPLVLDFQLGGQGGFGGFGGFGGRGGAGEVGPVKYFAKDAAGKEVPPPEDRRAGGEDPQQPKPEDRPVHLTVLKPGQTLEQPVMGALRLPNQGKYTVWAVIDVPAKDEILTGVKSWSGKIKSAEVEYDYQGFGGRGNRGNRGNNQAPAPAPAPLPGGKEAF